jgi:hypothetical protein
MSIALADAEIEPARRIRGRRAAAKNAELPCSNLFPATNSLSRLSRATISPNPYLDYRHIAAA